MSRRNPRRDGSARTRAADAGRNSGWPDWADNSSDSAVDERPNSCCQRRRRCKPIGVLHHVAGLVAQDAHALAPGAAFDVDDHLALEPHQPRMREIERNGDARRVVRAEPFARKPGVRPDARARSAPARRAESCRQSSSQVPSTVSLRSLSRTSSSSSSGSSAREIFARHGAYETRTNSAPPWCHGGG